MTENPYAPPSTDGHAHTRDAADLFTESLPTSIVRAAAVFSLLGGFVALFSFVLIFIGARQNTIAMGFEAILAVCGLGLFAVAWGLQNGRTSLLVLGLVLAPLFGLASLFLLLVTGAFAGLIGGGMSLLVLALLIASAGPVNKMSRARAGLARLDANDRP